MLKSNAMRFFVVLLGVLALGSMLLVACQRPGVSSVASGSGSSPTAPSTPTVHMNDANFVQASVTIPKGSALMLIDDAAVIHIIMNGSWVNGASEPVHESGAPMVTQQFQGNDSHDIGPFNTAGTFHLYCTIHPGMNLMVIVQ